MRRRNFIAGLASTTVAWPLAARAQQRGKVATIGFLGPATPSVASKLVAAFVNRLRDLGWVESRNLTIEYRWAEGQNDRYAEIASEFVALNVDLIVTWGSAPVLAAKQATGVIPIVFAAQMDPISVGVVRSLSRPGGNITGLSLQQTDTTGKRLELLREVVTNLRRLAIMGNVGTPGVVLEMAEMERAARALGIDITTLEVRSAENIVPAIESIKDRADALYIATDPLVLSNRTQITALSTEAGLPTIYGSREYVEAGGFMSYGPNYSDLFRRAAELADKILRGAKPADLPVEQPTKFDLVINLKTAKTLGLTVPPTLLARADEVIE
jgi:putative ABC transport system substrate-binding protein